MEEVEALGAEARAFSTRLDRVLWSMPVPKTAMFPFVKEEEAKDLTSATVRELCAGAKRDLPRPERKARECATSTARVVGSSAAASVSASIRGRTYSSNSWRVNLAEVIKEVRRSTKNGL